jgi:septum formation protein
MRPGRESDFHRPLVLASASPRRARLLGEAGFEFEIVPSTIDERAVGAGQVSPSRHAVAVALAKAREVLGRRPEACVLGADTMVILDGEALGKPRDADEALWMLSRLSGRGHEVITGLALVGEPGAAERTAVETTAVRFLPWPAAFLKWYAATGEPLDKAGGYGIQGAAGAYVERVDGCYFNVVGLPVPRLLRLIEAPSSSVPGAGG